MAKKEKTKHERKTSGEGSLRYRKDIKKYEARFGCVDPDTGKFLRKSFYSEMKTDALKQGRKWVSDIEGGNIPHAEKMTLGEWIETWLEDYAKVKVRIKTYEKYASCLNCYIKPNMGDTLLIKLRTENIQNVFKRLLIDGSAKKKPLSSSVVRSTRRYLMQCLDQAVTLGLLIKNPCRGTTPVSLETKEIKFLTEDKIKVAIAHLNESVDNAKTDEELFRAQTFRMIIILAIGTGMRAGELLGLSWCNVKLTDKEPAVNVLRALTFSNSAREFAPLKTKQSKRKILISNFEVNAFNQYLAWQNSYKEKFGDIFEDHGLVFTSTIGTPLDYSKVTKRFRRFRKAIGADDVRFHDLRHTHASLLLTKGVNPKVVQERLGHTTVTMTLDTYSHLIPSMQQTAASAIDSMLAQ